MSFDREQRVSTPLGPGRVVYLRMAPPTYTEVSAVSVYLDTKAGLIGYSGTIFAAADVLPL